MFLQVCVILFTGVVPDTTPGTRYTPLGPGAPQDQVHSPGPGTPPEARYTPTPTPTADHAQRYGQHAGGTHPTGMHSCL